MFEKFTSAGADDFRQRYQGTYGFFYREKDNKRMLSRLESIDGEVCRFVDAREIEYQLNADAVDKVGFEFIPPKSCFYNTPDGVRLVQRIAARQFLRGICSKNVAIYGFDLKGSSGLYPVRLDFKNLDSIYNKALSPKEAAAVFAKGEPFAISKQFAFVRGAIYLWDNKVGSYSTEDHSHYQVKLDEPDLWRTEITDALTALSKTAEVA